jgi:uncharacterized protein YjbI with pentapeptide repeats
MVHTSLRKEERQVDQEQPRKPLAKRFLIQEQPRKPLAKRLLGTVGIDPNKWTAADRSIALLGIGIGLTIVIITVCGYVFELAWTGLIEPQRTFWDWLSLLIVPIVLALGGYLFARAESRRTWEDADQQRTLDREIADERRQDDMLQAYLDGMSQLLTDEKRPLHRSLVGDTLSTVARARTLTVLTRLDGERKQSVLQFLYESGLIAKNSVVVALGRANLNGANLSEANLSEANLSEANLNGGDLSQADLSEANLSGAQLVEASLSGADLREADLSRAYLIKASLNEANLSGAYLNRADLSGAHLSKADLSGAYLRKADLIRAYLSEANLSGADLSGANLSGASMSSPFVSNVREVREVNTERLEQQAKSLEGATMPDGQKYEDWLKDKEGRGEDGENSGPS